MNLLENRVAIVTGAASGIGRAVALLYAQEGAKVVIADVDEKGGNETVQLLTKKGGNAIFVKTDSSNASDNAQMVRAAVEKFGRLDIACNNAGIVGPYAPTGEYPIDGWQKVIDVNLSGVFYGMRYQIPAMLKSGGGAIVNLSSIAGEIGTPQLCAYTAAKHGVIGLTKSAALEYSSKNIRVNAVGPAVIETPMVTDNYDEAARKALVELHPIGRLGKAEEVAELILWLSSPKASFVTGVHYTIDGGYLAK